LKEKLTDDDKQTRSQTSLQRHEVTQVIKNNTLPAVVGVR